MIRYAKKFSRGGMLCLKQIIRGASVATLLAGCSAMTPIHDYCQIAHPILLAKGEAAKLSDATAREILTNNETYQKVCGK